MPKKKEPPMLSVAELFIDDVIRMIHKKDAAGAKRYVNAFATRMLKDIEEMTREPKKKRGTRAKV